METNTENVETTVDEKQTTTTTTTTTTPTITKDKKKRVKKSTIELLNEQQEKLTLNQSNLSSFKTRGQKRATETYDYLFGNIKNTKKDIDTLFGYDLDGPSEQELIVYFNQFPKKTIGKIVVDDLTNYVNQTYNADEKNKIKVGEIFKSIDSNNVGEINANDFAVYLSESIIEESKSKGLIIEIDSEDEKPKKRARAATTTTKKTAATTASTKVTKASKKVDKTKEKAKKLKEKEKAKKLKLKEKEKAKKAKKSTTKKPKVRASKKKIIQSDDEEEEEEEMDTLEGGNVTNTNTGEGSANGTQPMWQYEFTPGKYLDYTPEASAITELAYQDWLTNPYTDVRSVKSGQWCYQIDFKANTQTNIQHEDHTSRNIRRVLK